MGLLAEIALAVVAKGGVACGGVGDGGELVAAVVGVGFGDACWAACACWFGGDDFFGAVGDAI
nr:hypothetical protein [uncultured Undibacterium sp.]